MNNRGLAVKIIIVIIAALVLISGLTALLNKKDKITSQVTSQFDKKSDNIVEEIIVGEEAKQAGNKINEFSRESDLNNNFAGNNTNNTEGNKTYYLQLLKLPIYYKIS